MNLFRGYGVEVKLKESTDFLKVKETLTRMGDEEGENVITQACHILHKQGRYAIVHYNELYALDGKNVNITDDDIAKRNVIANLLAQWGLLSIVDRIEEKPVNGRVKVIPFKDKKNYRLETKYVFGKKK
jgi:hypothetical protein